MRWRVPPQFLLFALFLVLLLLVLNASAYLTLIQVRGTLEQELGERLLAVASATASGLSPLLPAAGEPGALPDSLERARLRERLERIAFDTGLGELYLCDAGRRLLVDASGRLPAGYAHPALDLHYAAATAALAGVPAASELYRVEGLYLRTAFAPLFDAQGRVVGLVAAEGGSAFFGRLAGLRRQVFVTAGAGMLLALALAVLFYRLLRARALAERTLRETSALAAAGELAAMLAHEIRNPLAVVSSRAERVEAKIRQGRPAEDVLEWFAAIPREVARLDEILARYLSFARPGEARGEAEIGDAVESVLALMREDFERRGVRVEWQRPAGSPRAALPVAALHQVLVNLLLNARDAMPAGGLLRIETRRSGARILLALTDSGGGLTPEAQRRAFEPFFTTRQGGSGLGLAIVRSLLELHDARIELENLPGRGLRVALWLPAATGSGETPGHAG